MAEDRTRPPGAGGPPEKPREVARGVMRDPATGEEYVPEADWRPAFHQRMSQLIGTSLWMIILYMCVGSLLGLLLGSVAGRGISSVFYSLGLYSGIERIYPEAIQYVHLYNIAIGALVGLVAGMGVGMRIGVVQGNVSVSKAVLNPIIEKALSLASGARGMENAPRGMADRVRYVPAGELLDSLKLRLAVVENHVEGFGVSKLFRRYVSAQTVDYLEDVTRIAAAKLCEGPDRMITPDNLVRIRDAVMRWMKRHAAQSSLLIIFTFVAMPILALCLLVWFPALTIFLL